MRSLTYWVGSLQCAKENAQRTATLRSGVNPIPGKLNSNPCVRNKFGFRTGGGKTRAGAGIHGRGEGGDGTGAVTVAVDIEEELATGAGSRTEMHKNMASLQSLSIYSGFISAHVKLKLEKKYFVVEALLSARSQ